jgi:DNA-binding transcriptional MerR regulator
MDPPPLTGRLTTGALACVAGVSPDTIRSYERLGLLEKARRTQAGYRIFTAESADRVRAIRAAIGLGFSTSELRVLFKERAAGRPPCQKARRLAQQHLQAVTAQLEALARAREALKAVLSQWDDHLAGQKGNQCWGCSTDFPRSWASKARLALPPRDSGLGSHEEPSCCAALPPACGLRRET